MTSNITTQEIGILIMNKAIGWGYSGENYLVFLVNKNVVRRFDRTIAIINPIQRTNTDREKQFLNGMYYLSPSLSLVPFTHKLD